MAERFTIELPTALTGFAPDLTFHSSSAHWMDVLAGEDAPRRGFDVRVPDFVFDAERRVEDETVYRLARYGTLSDLGGPPEAGCIAIMLESPHRVEFAGRGGRAIGPLRDPKVRSQVRKHLPRLIADLERRSGEQLAGRSIAFVNAVQYQTSLQAIMRDYDGGLRSGVRTPVWKRIFANGGAENLLERLRRYDPRVVLLATTGVVRRDVRTSFAAARSAFPWIEVNHHPSYWGRSDPRLEGELNLPRGGLRDVSAESRSRK